LKPKRFTGALKNDIYNTYCSNSYLLFKITKNFFAIKYSRQGGFMRDFVAAAAMGIFFLAQPIYASSELSQKAMEEVGWEIDNAVCKSRRPIRVVISLKDPKALKPPCSYDLDEEGIGEVMAVFGAGSLNDLKSASFHDCEKEKGIVKKICNTQ
jgi:hypothetical protein